MLWIALIVVGALLTYWWWSDHRKHRGPVDIDGVQRLRHKDEGSTGFYGQG